MAIQETATEKWYAQNSERFDQWAFLWGSEMIGIFNLVLLHVQRRIDNQIFLILEPDMIGISEDEVVEMYLQRVFFRLEIMKVAGVKPVKVWGSRREDHVRGVENLLVNKANLMLTQKIVDSLNVANIQRQSDKRKH